MNDLFFLVPLTLLMMRATTSTNVISDFMGCLLASGMLYGITKTVLLAIWLHGLTYPVQASPAAHWGTGATSFALVATLLVVCIHKRQQRQKAEGGD